MVLLAKVINLHLFSVSELVSLLKETDFQVYKQAAKIHRELRKVCCDDGQNILDFLQYILPFLRSLTQYQLLRLEVKMIFFQQTISHLLYHLPLPLHLQKCHCQLFQQKIHHPHPCHHQM